MTETEAIALADVPDWWIGASAQAQKMRSLREALAEAAAEERPRLFRPGGFGVAAIWLSGEDIHRLHGVLSKIDASAAA